MYRGSLLTALARLQASMAKPLFEPAFLQDRAIELKDPACSKCCPDCFYVITALLTDGPTLDAACQPPCHDFWSACVAALTTPRTDQDIAALRTTLRANAASCPERKSDYHRRDLIRGAHAGELDDPLHRFIHALYQCLCLCVSPTEDRSSALLSVSRPKKTFGNTRGRWPLHPKDLIPLGARQSVDMHVYWCCQLFSPAAISYLYMTMLGCRSLVFPNILESPLREGFVWSLVQMLNGDTARDAFRWPSTVQYALPERLPKWLCASESHTMSVHIAADITGVIASGPDGTLDEPKKLYSGFEAALLPALNNALDVVQKDATTITQARESLCQLAMELHGRCPQWRGQLHPLARAWQVTRRKVDTESLEPARSALMRRYYRRTCYGPSCTNGIVDSIDGKPLPLCAGCKFTQYCCKGCQMADWKRAPLPHKHLCPVLRSLKPVLQKPTSEFEVVLRSLDWGEVDRQQFRLWLFD